MPDSEEKGGRVIPEPDLLVTKFTLPPLRSVLVPREPLMKVLNENDSSPLTLLCASAGFGKTTLLSAWARQSTRGIAWLSLDEQDNDPARFWTYVVASLRKAGSQLSTVGEVAEALLRSPQPSPLTSVLTSLINELAARSQETTLILDDYHLISDQAIHSSLQFLLDHRPACLHLVLASRVDPPLALARLRASAQVTEIREGDLRLCSEESATFLNEVMGLALPEEEIACLEQRTEGWIAGLQLAALSLRKHADVTAWISAFTGGHRLIADYVQEEILAPLSESQQGFLLYTSVLERMNAEICQVLTGEPASQQMLEVLERAHLFLAPLDEERRWYRWHTLFREALLARLQAIKPEEVPHLHREAALWYQRQGWPHETIPHALATQDFAFVAGLLEDCIERLYLLGELTTLLGWIRRLPQEVLRAHPRLATSYILVFNMLSPFSDGEEKEYLNLLWASIEQMLQNGDQNGLSLVERDRLRHRVTILQAWKLVKKALSDANVEQLNSVAEKVQYLSLDDDNMWKLQGGVAFGMASRLAGNFPPLVSAIQESRKMIWMRENRALEVPALWGLIAGFIALGQLSQARDSCQELQGVINQLGIPAPVAAYPNLFRAQLAYAWNQLDVAKGEALIAIEKTAPLQYLDILMGAYEVLSRVCIAQDDLAGAEQAIGEMERLNVNAEVPLFRPWIEGLWVQLWLAQGNLIAASDWGGRTSCREETFSYSQEGTHLALVRVYLAEKRYPQALQLLSTLLNRAESVSRVESIISILALQVAALQASRATDEALRILARLLECASPEGYLRVFLDGGEPMQHALKTFLANEQYTVAPALIGYARMVLTLIESARRVTTKPTTSASLPPASSTSTWAAHSGLLTPRELEVLHLLEEGITNQEIARRLVVSLATAKKHVANILSKLGAKNRTQAVAYARSRSLL